MGFNIQKNNNGNTRSSFLIKGVRRIKYLLLAPIRMLLPKEKINNADVFPSKGFEPNSSFSFWLIDSYMKDLIEEPLLGKLADDASELTLRDCGMGVWHWDIRTDVVFYSSETLKILEVESDDLFDTWERWYKIVHPDDLVECFAYIQKCFDRETTTYEHCYRVKTSSGKYKWIIDKARVVSKDEQGRPLRVAGVHTDVSFQRIKELEKDETLRGYIEQNKQLLNFTQIVSHNLSAQISNITLLLDVNDLTQSKDASETLANLRIISNDLNDTISHLSEVVAVKNRAEVLIKPLVIYSFLRKVLFSIQTQIDEKKVTIINNIPQEAMVNFNPAYLESVLLNLSTNAIKYAHPKRPAVITFDFFKENKKKVLTVADNGLGIDLEKYGDVLFDIYKTFHKSVNGSGLGLHMVKNQIDAMQGKIEVTSIVGEGTSFKIIFRD